MKKQKEIGKKILLIIPAYNEEENILTTFQAIQNYNKKSNEKLDVIVINDGSTDRTGEICQKNKIPHINLIQNLGIGGAVQTGYKYALENNYDIAIQFDGDGQHDVNYIPNLLRKMGQAQADLVIGSRFLDKSTSEFKSTGTRRIGIKIISFLIRLFTRKKITDPTSGFRAASKRTIEHFSCSYPKEYPEPESIVNLVRKGYSIAETPVKMKERVGGVSSIRSWKSVYYMINVSLSIFITSLKGRRDC